MAPDEPDVLALLAEHELAIKRLYEAFAEAFADRREFWEALAKEEQGHADGLGTLRSLPAPDGPLQLGGGLRPQAIKTSIKYVEDQTMKARAGSFRLVQALAIAKDLEHALIEEQFSRMRKPAHAQAQSVLARLAQDTMRHRDSLAAALAAERRARV